MLRAAFWFLIVAASADIIVCTYWLYWDWKMMDAAYWEYKRLIGAGAGQRELFIAHSFQNIHRINVFAEGVGFMVGAVLWGVGFLGLALVRPNRQMKESN